MKSKLILSLVAMSGLTLLPAAGFANSASKNANNTTAQGEGSSEKVRKVTGCLAKEGDDYTLTADNGATWELKGDAVNLSDHVGHTVTVTGTVDHNKMHGAKEKAKEKTEDNPKEHGHLTVTNIKHVKESCSR